MLRIKTRLVSLLEDLGQYAYMLGDRYPAQAYRKAALTIQSYRGSISIATESSWTKLPGIGKSIHNKILEYLNSGRIEKIERYRRDPTIRSVQRLCTVKGIGPRRALTLVRQNIKNINDLRRAVSSNDIKLTPVQNLCLHYHADLVKRIPPKEMDWFANRLRQIARSIPGIACQVVGSYRRYRRTQPRKDSGDVDVLLINNSLRRLNQVKQSQFLSQFVAALERRIECKRLTLGKTKFWGLIRRSKKDRYRHLDIRLMPTESHATALLHMTGSKDFNRYLRTAAIQQGFKLNEYALTNMTENRRVKVSSERDVFTALTVPYRSPAQRNL